MLLCKARLQDEIRLIGQGMLLYGKYRQNVSAPDNLHGVLRLSQCTHYINAILLASVFLNAGVLITIVSKSNAVNNNVPI